MTVTSPRYFFVHLQKTAGTALWRRLRCEFDPVEVYPGPGDGSPPESVLSVDHLRDRWRARSEEIRIVTGHFPLCTAELLGGPFRTLTVLREPVERTLSFLRHHRETSPEHRDMRLEEIYDDPLRRRLACNHMVKMLAMTPDEMTDGALSPVACTPDHLERACRRLDGVDVVGIQERFDRFCDELASRFGWALGPPVTMNRTQPVEVTGTLRERIAADNSYDRALYAYAWRRITNGTG